MRISKKIIIGMVTLILIILVTTMIIINYNKSRSNKSKKHVTTTKKERPCSSIDGGSYKLYFVTNNDQKLEALDICIACNPDSYKELPTLNKEGYTFEGWYYDKEFHNKINNIKTNYIKVRPKKNSKGCVIDYEDITIYAKWKKDDDENGSVKKDNKENNNKQITKNKSNNKTEEKKETKVVQESLTPESRKLKRPTITGKISRVENDTTRNGYNPNAYESFIKTGCGDNIYALGNGSVKYTNSGGMAIIKHSYGGKDYLVAYMDFSNLSVSRGQEVSSDTVIGKANGISNDCGLFSFAVFPYDENNLNDNDLNQGFSFFNLLIKGSMVNPVEIFDIPSDNNWNTR